MDTEIPKSEINRRRRRTAIRYSIIGTMAAGVITLISSLTMSGVSAKSLKFAIADRGDIDVTVSATGSVVPAFEEVINSPVATKILEVYRRPGDEVNAGDPLMKLDLEEIRTQYENQADELAMIRLDLKKLATVNNSHLRELQMQIDVEEMKINRLTTQLANELRLDSIGSGTGERVREVEFTLHTEKLELDKLRQQLADERRMTEADLEVKALEISVKEKQLALTARMLEDAEIRAPRHATITSIASDIGATVNAGQEMVRIADLGHFKIEGEIAESHSRDIRTGSRVTVKAGSNIFEGTVSNIAPTANNGLVSFYVNLDCDSTAELRPGLRPDIHISNGIKNNVVRIPNGAFYTGDGSYNLFVDTGDGILERRTVNLGKAGFDYIEVISGISTGERVVVSDMKRYSGKKTLKIRK